MNTVMTLKEWNALQIKEALSSTNRYFHFLKYGNTNPTDSELVIYYIENGGAVGFRERNEQYQKQGSR